MVYKKDDEFTKICGSIGGKNGFGHTHKFNKEIHLKNGRKLQELYPIKEKIIKDKEFQSNAGRKSRYYENKKAEEIKSQYDSMFLPQSICDRICFDKKGKLVFIEIKQRRQSLKEKQKEFKELCEKFGYTYIVEYIDKI